MQTRTEERGTAVFESGLFWFNTGVSMVKIRTGIVFAALGFTKGLLAILVGHVIACALVFFLGLMGGKLRKNSLDIAKMSFGQNGILLFSLLNFIQFAGLATILIHDSAHAVNGIFHKEDWIWCIVIGGLIMLWILIGIKNFGKISRVAMWALFILTLILFYKIFGSGNSLTATGKAISFGSAVEVSLGMPLAWLPQISNYSREYRRPVASTAVSVITHGIISAWMFIIGMSAAMFTGKTEGVQILLQTGFGVVGLVIIICSTVMVAFTNVYSAGVIGEATSNKINRKCLSVAVALFGILGAIFLPLTDITGFLRFVGSLFIPVAAIQIADFYILKKNEGNKKLDVANLVIWLVGFVIYHLLMKIDIVVGSALPNLIIVVALCVAVNKIRGISRK